MRHASTSWVLLGIFCLLLWAWPLSGCVRFEPERLGGPLVGLERLSVVDPMAEKPLAGIAFYPPAASLEGGVSFFGPWPLEGRLDVPVEPRRHPLIVIVHGHQGTRFGHHDLGEVLARAGYVVAAVDHAGDSWDDQRDFGTDRSLFRRAYQASALIDTVLADARLGPAIDPERIGVVGFSAGGLTALLLLGAQPDFSRLPGYCERHRGDEDLCAAPPKLVLAHPRSPADERVKAAFLMAPLGVVVSEPSLKAITRPVFLAAAERDAVLLPEDNAAVVMRGLHLDTVRVIPDAGHYVFLAPCPAGLREELPAQCRDVPGVDRVAVHATLATDAVGFFERSL